MLFLVHVTSTIQKKKTIEQLCAMNMSALSSLQTVLPTELDIRSVYKAPKVERDYKIWRPENQQGYTTKGDNMIRFKIPDEILDLKRSTLMMRVTLEKTGGTYVRLAQGCPIIDRVRIVIGGTEMDSQFYNRSMNYQWNTSVDSDIQATIGQDKMGYGTQTDRNAQGADPNGTIYSIIMKSGILNNDILPMKILNQLGGKPKNAFIEMTLAQPRQCLESDGDNLQITVSQLEWDYWQLSGEAWEADLRKKISSGSFKFGYRDWTVFQNSVQSAANDLQIPWRGSSLNSIHTILVAGADLNNPLKNDRYTTWPKELTAPGEQFPCRVDQYTYCFNNNWDPQEAIDCRGDADRAYNMYLLDQGVWDNRMHMKFQAPIDEESFNKDQFTMILDYQSVPRNVWNIQTQDSIFNDLSSLNNTMNIILRLNLSNPPPPNTTAYHLISHNVVMNIDSNGELIKVF
jgi:hypothetical protein